MSLSIIVAYGKDYRGKNVIGKENKIPWSLPHDLARFREYTLGNAVVMGRKTFESIGRVLPRRENIIVSRDPNLNVKGAYVFNDLDDALGFAKIRNSEVFIIGGEEIYTQTLDKATRLYLTEVKNNSLSGDAFFPSIPFNNFKRIHHEEGPLDTFSIFEKHDEKTTFFSEGENNPYADVGMLSSVPFSL